MNEFIHNKISTIEYQWKISLGLKHVPELAQCHLNWRQAWAHIKEYLSYIYTHLFLLHCLWVKAPERMPWEMLCPTLSCTAKWEFWSLKGDFEALKIRQLLCLCVSSGRRRWFPGTCWQERGLGKVFHSVHELSTCTLPWKGASGTGAIWVTLTFHSTAKVCQLQLHSLYLAQRRTNT